MARVASVGIETKVAVQHNHHIFAFVCTRLSACVSASVSAYVRACGSC